MPLELAETDASTLALLSNAPLDPAYPVAMPPDPVYPGQTRAPLAQEPAEPAFLDRLLHGADSSIFALRWTLPVR